MADDVALVPLNLGELDEDQLAQVIPTPQQAVYALLVARDRIARAPREIAKRRDKVRRSEQEVRIAKGYAVIRAQEYRTYEERRKVADADPEVLNAEEALIDAKLELDYALELRKTLSEDVEILRSLNANLRGEGR